MLTIPCPRCGIRNPAAGLYCTNCGFQIANPQPQAKQTPSYVIIAVVVISVLFGVFGLLSLVVTNNKPVSDKVQTLASSSPNSALPDVPTTQPESNYIADSQNVIDGKVVAIQDGDTITVLDATKTQHKIRLQGIDAPELDQPFGQASKQNLSALVFGNTVRVEWNKLDKYGRKVGLVYSKNNEDINLKQIKAGLAWHYKEYQNEQTQTDRELYAAAEKKARSDENGLWNDADPMSPWDYRHGSKRNASLASTSNQGEIIGNSSSYIYHWPGCPNYSDISLKNRVYFKTTEEAENAGYRAARNCRSPKPDIEETEDAPSLAGTTPVYNSQKPAQAAVEEEAPAPRAVYRTPNSSSYPQTTPMYSRSTPSYSTSSPTTSVPTGASAKCNDGTYSYSASRRGTCSKHGGVAVWY